MPGRKEPREDFGIDRFHLVAQLGQAAAPQPPQHGRIAPLALVAVGSKLAMHQPVVDFQLPEFCRGPVGRNPEPSGGFGGGERTVGARSRARSSRSGAATDSVYAPGRPGGSAQPNASR